MSGVGKGVATASIAKILQSKGFEVTVLKIDPYVNVDAGTMSPTEHGEVFVLKDGMECDQDMGNYERFLDREFTKENYMTTGSVYLSVINRERNLEYHGKQVEVVPHIPLEVIDRINNAVKKNKADIALIEIGGTVGEYQNILFLEAVRMLKTKQPHNVLLALVSLFPALGAGGTEIKTKPTQYAIRTLNSAGLQPDLVIARAKVALDEKKKKHLAFNCNLEESGIISAPDVNNIYEIPLNFEKDNLAEFVLKKLKLRPRQTDMLEWRSFIKKINSATKPISIGIVGKYFGTGNYILTDSYISVIEAIKCAAYTNNRKPIIEWIDAEEFEKSEKNLKNLARFDGIVVPGGFGSRGVEGKISAIRYLREHKIPFFGLCYGMQLAIVEFARHKLGLKNASSLEFNAKTSDPVINVMSDQKNKIQEKNMGASMRLGAYNCKLSKNTIAYQAYGKDLISERHRHRYEFNNTYRENFEKNGLIFSGINPEQNLVEIAELPKKDHPFFLGTQFHPEFKSRPLEPHPLFLEFIKAATNKK